jgi:plasmid stabilization system protein ParE
MIVVISAEAEVDLEVIGDHIAEDNPARARNFIRELRGRCIGLADIPKAFPLVPRYEHHGVRWRVHGQYLIFYRLEAETVTVLHILHGAMDYAAILFPS